MMIYINSLVYYIAKEMDYVTLYIIYSTNIRAHIISLIETLTIKSIKDARGTRVIILS